MRKPTDKEAAFVRETLNNVLTRNGIGQWQGDDRNKAKGMLWGLVVGDAFGSPIQFSGKDSHPWITEMVAFENGCHGICTA